MTRGDRIHLALAAAACAAMAAYCWQRMDVVNEITAFIPAGDDARLAEISRKLVDTSLTRTLILSVESTDAASAVAGAKQMATALRADPEVEWLRSGVEDSTALGERFWNLYFPRRYHLLSDDPERELPARLSDEGLAEAARELKHRLSQPSGALVKRFAGADPLLGFADRLRRLESARDGPLQVQDGQFTTTHGRHAVIFLASRHSAFDGTFQGPLQDTIRKAFDDANARAGGTLRLEQSAVARFALESERIVKADIGRISTLSTVAIVLLFLVLFRSLRVLLLSFMPILFGVLFANTATLLLFGRVHAVTLAFGSSLVGVCVDYPIHFLNRHALEPAPDGPHGTLRRIREALLLGSATTVAGFAGLALTDFPGLREMAVYATAGIGAALFSTCFHLPALSAARPVATRLHRRVADAVGRLIAAMVRRRRVLVALPVGAVILCAAGLARVRWDPSLSMLNRVDPAMLDEDGRVRALVSRMDASRLFIATGPDEETALRRNDALYVRLVAARKDGVLGDFRSLHDLVTSAALQARNAEAVRASPRLAERMTAALSAEGFRPEAFTGFVEALSEPVAAPLRPADLEGTPMDDLLRSFRTRLDGETAIVTLLRDVRDSAALEARTAELEGVRLFDQDRFLDSTYVRCRTRVIELVLAGIVVVTLMVLVAYRRIRPAAGVMVPALLSALGGPAVLALAGVQLNLLHIVAALLVLSMGEDFAEFFIQAADDPRALQATGTSVVLCALSTVLGFGLLGMSQMPALQALGLTTAIGVLLSLLLSPTALVFAGTRRGR